jgi:hypothetical protein
MKSIDMADLKASGSDLAAAGKGAIAPVNRSRPHLQLIRIITIST